MLNAKDFYIQYMSEVGEPPSEEEWLAYIDQLSLEAEARKDWEADPPDVWDGHKGVVG